MTTERTATRARVKERVGFTKFTPTQVAKALTAARGLISIAAKSLGCNRATVYDYIKRHPTLKDTVHNARETTIDHVESKLMEAIDGGDVHAMIFFLKTQGKSRGYVERSELALNPDSEDIKFTMNIGNANGQGRESE